MFLNDDPANDFHTDEYETADGPYEEYFDIPLSTEARLALRKKAALSIDPATAKIDWHFGQIKDPYRVRCGPPDNYESAGRVYFACSPENLVWVCFDDLPSATVEALEKRKRQQPTADLIAREAVQFAIWSDDAEVKRALSVYLDEIVACSFFEPSETAGYALDAIVKRMATQWDDPQCTQSVSAGR